MNTMRERLEGALKHAGHTATVDVKQVDSRDQDVTQAQRSQGVDGGYVVVVTTRPNGAWRKDYYFGENPDMALEAAHATVLHDHLQNTLRNK
ncbi:hypothetical protein I6H08_37660 (plasmid) [Burkholderia gladioli]|uniref:hypothetical protein n=1 Tax=Burkholderia gladioli TaxID=28095 RepID=UPI00193813CD|nr:hypothetical protein [Burkholderia gladioli]QPQ88813.1 hypothetical protein I6H08_37660 [Burkholderia gladioli]